MSEQQPRWMDHLIGRVHEEMGKVVRQHTVAIIAHYGGLPHQHATGTLVRFADHRFLITASHAVKQFLAGQKHHKDIQLYLENGVSGLVPLLGEYHATKTVRDRQSPSLSFEADVWDVAIWDLHPVTVNALSNKSFLNRRDISITANLESGVYFLAGFPCAWSQADPASRTMTFTALGYIAGAHANPTQLADYDHRFHMALSLEPTKPIADFEGISGCSIWKIADSALDSQWSASSARVVAVQTGVYTKHGSHAIKGTKWSCVVNSLGRRFPELVPAFNVWLPGRE